MNLIIRADADSQMGTGHLMRSLALGQAWQDAGGQVAFVTATHAAPLVARLQSEGMTVVPMPGPPGGQEDARFTANQARDLEAQWVVVDGYHFGADYQRLIKDSGLRLLFVDDYGHCDHYYADMVLNQNIYAHEGFYAQREAWTRLLLGTRYALLRREFWPWRGWRREIPEVARKVLVTLGGSDPANVTLKVVRALTQVNIDDLEAVVVGGANPHLELLKKEIRDESRMHLRSNVANMPELMAWADVSITAGGTTCWELAFMGLPGLIIILADNQQPMGQWLDQSGIGVNLGWHDALSLHQISQPACDLLGALETRKEMALKGQALIDGEGVDRVLMFVQDHRLRLRRVRDNDCQLLWRWANDTEVREASFITDAILWEDHVRWFSQKRNDPSCLQFIAVDDREQPVGQVRFDIKEGESAEIDVSIDKERRGLGYGKLILNLATAELFRNTRVKTINSFIKIDNIKSIKAFEKAKYWRIGPLVVHGEKSVRYVRERGD